MNTTEPERLLSVIVPVYNVEKYVGRCLDSIISQTYKNWECVVVDDGTPDNSGHICDEYAKLDSRIRVIHKENGGVGSARNTGLLNIRGDYLTFVDSDDTIEPDSFSNYMKYAADYDWVMIGVRDVDLELNPLGNKWGVDEVLTYSGKASEGGIVKATQCMSFPPTWNKLYHVDIIRDNNLLFVTTTNVNEDRIFNLKYAMHAKSIALLPNLDYNWVMNPKSITHSKIKSTTFLNTGLELDAVLSCNLLGERMQQYTAVFACRHFVRALIEGILHPYCNRCKEICAAFKGYFGSTMFKKYGLKTFGWTATYIIEGINKKV